MCRPCRVIFTFTAERKFELKYELKFKHIVQSHTYISNFNLDKKILSQTNFAFQFSKQRFQIKYRYKYIRTSYHTFKSCVVLLQNFYETGENCVVTLIGKLGHQWSIRIKSFDVYGQTDAAGNPVNCYHFVKMYDGRYSFFFLFL